MKLLHSLPTVLLLVIATSLEVSGDAVIRIAITHSADWLRAGLFVLGAALLLGYGTFLNLSPLEFGQIVGLYISTLFLMWQLANYLFFRTVPTLPIWVGGAMIFSGGLVVTFWRP